MKLLSLFHRPSGRMRAGSFPKAMASVPKPANSLPRVYQEAYANGAVFFKDATPKADHFVQFRVTLPKSLQDVISGDAPRVELKLLAVNGSGERVVVVVKHPS